MTIPRPEYPRPQLFRNNWENLNGPWEFEIDYGNSGFERKIYENRLSGSIIVPFCPESPLSGVNNKDFMPAVWYRRTFNLDKAKRAGRTIFHFGASDYETVLFINGKDAGKHFGGYASFSFDITDYVTEGINTAVIWVKDDLRSRRQPFGKQCLQYYSQLCSYTRTTGIWQTLWLEFVPQNYIKEYKVIPDPENHKALLTVRVAGYCYGKKINAAVKFKNKAVCAGEAVISGNSAYFVLPIDELHLWEPGNPNLYDLEITFEEDHIEGYFGMRSVSLTNNELLLNGKSVFQRLVLDQGFYPDGICTAPSDEALKRDIELSMEAGFNGARLHQKVFEERFLYWADQLGYLCWGEFGDNGLDISGDDGFMHIAPEWREVVNRDFNHPSIIGWCPFNETGHQKQNNEILVQLYELTKQLDPSRPVIDTSGHAHVITDIFTVHVSVLELDEWKESFGKMDRENVFCPNPIGRDFKKDMPYFVAEYGGTWWAPDTEKSSNSTGWGYGEQCKSSDEVLDLIEGLTKTLLDSPRICGFCYIQLTDVEQEQNGIYYYNRRPKFDSKRLKEIFGAPAAIERK
ncbi:beta-glucuronidase [Spirochaetia bacterium]|nr:beta-glucuronidase [Spirochaetia bacterium]